METPRESRRHRQLRELRQEIITTAVSQLESHGPSGISLRGIARALGISAPAIYTYFPSANDLFTELIKRSNESLNMWICNALKRDPNLPVADQLLTGATAYRSWALAHRRQFNLIFFDQLIEYSAPDGGPTTRSQASMLQTLATPLAEYKGLTLEEIQSEASILDAFLGWWGSFHGLVALEVNHHLDWRDPEQIFRQQTQLSTQVLLETC